MKITVFNLKGGQGKTAISLNIALTLKYGIITNDIYTPLETILTKEQFLKLKLKDELPTLPKEYNIIFDFGGYADNRVIEAVKMSEHILIPIISNNKIDIQVAVNSIEEISKYNNNISLIMNRYKKENKDVKSYFKDNYQYPIFQLKESKVLDKMINEAKSIRELFNQTGLSRHTYKDINRQFEDIINHISKG